MRILNNSIYFGNSSTVTRSHGIRTTEEFNDNKVLISRKVYDEKHDRFISQSKFDEHGNPFEKWWFEYSKGKQVEHFESKESGSYVRTITDKIIDGFKVRTEEYVSKTNPENNYLYEITRFFDGKMKSFLCNGKKVF